MTRGLMPGVCRSEWVGRVAAMTVAVVLRATKNDVWEAEIDLVDVETVA